MRRGVGKTPVGYTFIVFGVRGGERTTQRASRQPKSGRQTNTQKDR